MQNERISEVSVDISKEPLSVTGSALTIKQFVYFLLTLLLGMLICAGLLYMSIKTIDIVENRQSTARNDEQNIEDYDDLKQLLLSDTPI